jgi:hypothetical protein
LDSRLDVSVIDDDGTTTAAKKGADNLDYCGRSTSKATRWQPSAIASASSSR